MSPLISVIIPVFNVEKYLEKSILSVCNQNYKNIEIILVNDGSEDSSGSLCDKLADSDSRIKVIHKENCGVSSARNAGIESASGEFICFIDGDDYVTPEYVSDMFNVAEKTDADIITSNQYKIWKDGKTEELFPQKSEQGSYFIKSGTDTLADMLYGKTCYATCCCKLYKKEIFESIRFPKLSMGEDSFTMYQCFLKAENVAHLYKPNYYYVQHEASAMHTTNYDKFYDYIELSDTFMKTVNSDYPELFLPAVNRLIENNFWVYMKMKNQPERYSAQIEHIISNIKIYRKYALTDRNVSLRTRAACLISYFGIKTLNIIYDKITT